MVEDFHMYQSTRILQYTTDEASHIYQLTLWFSADPLLHLDHAVAPLVGLGLRTGLQAFPHDPCGNLRELDVAEIEGGIVRMVRWIRKISTAYVHQTNEEFTYGIET